MMASSLGGPGVALPLPDVADGMAIVAMSDVAGTMAKTSDSIVVTHDTGKRPSRGGYLRDVVVQGHALRAFRGYPDCWYFVVDEYFRALIAALRAPKAPPLLLQQVRYSGGRLPLPAVVREELRARERMLGRVKEKKPSCVRADHACDVLAPWGVDVDWRRALAEMLAAGGLAETGVVGAFRGCASQYEFFGRTAPAGCWRQQPQAQAPPPPRKRLCLQRCRGRGGDQALHSAAPAEQTPVAAALTIEDTAAHLGEGAALLPAVEAGEAASTTLVPRAIPSAGPVYPGGLGFSRASNRLRAKGRTARQRRLGTGAGCYACLVAQQPCLGRKTKSSGGGVACRSCRQAGLTPRQCALPVAFLSIRPKAPRSGGVAAVQPCHICRSMGPRPGGIRCGVCGALVCADTNCQSAAGLPRNAPYFYCCHCLGVPYLCGCVSEDWRLLRLLLYAPLYDRPPLPLRQLSSQMAPFESPMPTQAPAVENQWLYRAASTRLWLPEEHALLVEELNKIRSAAEMWGWAEQPHRAAPHIERWLKTLPWPRDILAKYLHQLVEFCTNIAWRSLVPKATGGMQLHCHAPWRAVSGFGWPTGLERTIHERVLLDAEAAPMPVSKDLSPLPALCNIANEGPPPLCSDGASQAVTLPILAGSQVEDALVATAIAPGAALVAGAAPTQPSWAPPLSEPGALEADALESVPRTRPRRGSGIGVFGRPCAWTGGPRPKHRKAAKAALPNICHPTEPLEVAAQPFYASGRPKRACVLANEMEVARRKATVPSKSKRRTYYAAERPQKQLRKSILV
eukprot:NODE_947_length_2683_cov_5.030516.p1 GENE.NODE_947_length_2683_cov_5.030516~~NODE_947_length_2683_cov_5.030516.p1  ORF type:complete len:795 (-),score=167.41 NODE_947_length_2683_cov_5.030516:196-2580(-)